MWPPLPQALFARFIVHYTALLQVAVPGLYSFQLCYRDGVDLLVDGSPLVSDWRCRSDFGCQSATLRLNATGFVPLSLHYFSSGDAFGVQLAVQPPKTASKRSGRSERSTRSEGSNRSERSEQTAQLFFVPSKPFVYTSPLTHYVLGHAITPNYPIFFSLPTPISFVVHPALPIGLQLINGIITGNPRQARDLTEYTITSYSEKFITPVTTTVVFDVVDVEPPMQITFSDASGEPVTSLTVTMYAAVNLTLSADVPVFAWSVDELPKGLVFYPKELRVTGHVMEKLQSETFWVTCSNDGGSVTAPFTLHIVPCSAGSLLYSTLNDGAMMRVKILSDTGKVIISKVLDEPLYALAICLPSASYHLHAVCMSTGTDCNLHITCENDLILANIGLLQGAKTEVLLALNYSSAPVISTQSSIIYTQADAPVNVWFAVENPYYKVVFQPVLPATLTFDQATLRLTGTFATQGIFTYQLRAANDVGEGVLLLTVYVDHCPQNTSLIRLHRRATLFGEKLTVLRGNQTLYHFTFQVGPYTDMLCVPFDDFIIRMESETGMGWVAGSDLLIADDNDHPWGSFLLDVGQSLQEDVLHYSFLVDNATALRFLVSSLAPSVTWSGLQFDDDSWPLGSAGKWQSIPAGLATVYFRTKVDVTGDMTFLQISLFVREGLVLYVDGVELARENLPAGKVYHATTASAAFPAYRWMEYAVRTNRFIAPYTVIAVELHRQHVAAAAAVVFVMNAHMHYAPSLLHALGNLTSSDLPDAAHPAANAFDGCAYTVWETSPLPAWARLRFPNGERWAIDRLDLRIADSRFRAAPSYVRLYGERDGVEHLLGEWGSSLWFAAPFDSVSLFAANTEAYSAYRVEFPAVADKDRLQLSSIALYQALQLECVASDGWSSAEAGETLYRECGKAAGFVVRRCVRQGAVAAWSGVDRSGCVRLVPPIGRVYLDVVLAVWNCSVAEWRRDVGEAVLRVLVSELQVREEEVHLPSCEQLMVQSVFMVRSLVRVEGEASKKAVLGEALRKLAKDLSVHVQEELGEMGVGMSFVFEGEAVLRQNFTVLWIVLGSVAGLCIMAFFIMIVYRIWRQHHIVQFSKRTLWSCLLNKHQHDLGLTTSNGPGFKLSKETCLLGSSCNAVTSAS